MKHSDISKLNERIKKARKALHMQQKAMAASLGISQGHWSDIEAGRKNPSDTLIIALCNRYAINRQWLETGEGEMILPRAAEEAATYGLVFSNPDIKDMLEKISFIYNHGDDDQKAQLYGHVVRIYNRIQEGEGGGGESRAIRGLQKIKELERKGKKEERKKED
jgi:transcriptional regulator with XRE-family HTH domain